MSIADLPKGGRGKKAPYATTHYRIPAPLKDCFSDIAEKWKLAVIGETTQDFSITCGPHTWLTDSESLEVSPTASNSPMPIMEALEDLEHPRVQITKDEAVALAQKMIKAKKPSKELAMAELLSAIYGEKIEL